MMEDPFNPYSDSDPETLELAKRFEQMLKDDQHYFFDLDEFEELIDYYLFNNEMRKSESCIRLALEQYPGETGLLLKKAQYLISIDKNKKALKILSDLDHDNYGDYEVHLAKGDLYSQLDRSEKAIEEYSLALDHSDNLDEILSNIAFEYENLGKYEKAIEFLMKAIEQNPDNESALYELSFCFEIMQQREKAITFLEAYIDKRPFSRAAWFNLGIAFSNLELFEKAIDAYDYAIAIDETFASAYFNKANCYANLNNFPAAVETYLETSFHENPEPLTFYYIAECYEKMEKYESAIQYYTKALDLDPDFGDAWLGAGVAYDALNNPKVALTYVEHAIKIAPTIPDYWFLKGDIQIKLAQIDEGVLSYRKVIELEPNDPEVWLELSMVYADQQDYNKALEILKEGLKWHEKNPDFFYARSIYLFKTGKNQQAREVLENALTMDYEGHRKIFKAFPDLRENQTITDIIEGYRDKSQ
jgi:tetratricopeptide (TPR) repeat protein